MQKDELKQRLDELGLTAEQYDGVMEIMTQGITVDVTSKTFSMEAGHTTIKNTDDSCRLCSLDVNIEGINPNQIVSVTLPKIDYREANTLFTMQVELLPLALCKDLAALSNQMFKTMEPFEGSTGAPYEHPTMFNSTEHDK